MNLITSAQYPKLFEYVSLPYQEFRSRESFETPHSPITLELAEAFLSTLKPFEYAVLTGEIGDAEMRVSLTESVPALSRIAEIAVSVDSAVTASA